MYTVPTVIHYLKILKFLTIHTNTLQYCYKTDNNMKNIGGHSNVQGSYIPISTQDSKIHCHTHKHTSLPAILGHKAVMKMLKMKDLILMLHKLKVLQSGRKFCTPTEQCQHTHQTIQILKKTFIQQLAQKKKKKK